MRSQDRVDWSLELVCSDCLNSRCIYKQQVQVDDVARSAHANFGDLLETEVMRTFVQVDREKSGFLTPEAIHAFLADVGLEATPFDMRHIMAELDPEHTGIVSRSSFISFIRYGGQPAPPPKVSAMHSKCLASCKSPSAW